METFRLNKFPIGIVVGYEKIYTKVDSLFTLDGVIDQRIMQLLRQIRQNKTQSKQIFEDCFISFSNKFKEIGVSRATNVEEFKKRVLSSRTLFTPLSVLTQSVSTFQPPRVIVHNLVNVQQIIDSIKTACQDEDNIDEDKIMEVRGIALSYNYNIPPFLLESGRKCALCVGFDGDSIIPVPDFVKHSVPWVTNFYPPNRMTVNKCEGYKIFENRDTTSHLLGGLYILLSKLLKIR